MRLIATTVVHQAAPGDSHGGAYIIDLKEQSVHRVLDASEEDIEWFGVEGGRGLRGVAFDGETTFISSGRGIAAYNRRFRLQGEWSCPQLLSPHGMAVYQRDLFVTSTRNDSVIAFNLDERRFHWALQVTSRQSQYGGSTFDPLAEEGPLALNKLKLKLIGCDEGGMRLCGTGSGGLLHFNGSAVNMHVDLPAGVQDACLFRRGVLYIDSRAGALRFVGREDGTEDRALAIPYFEENDHEYHDDDEPRMLRRGYGRGLCLLNDHMAAVGHTPAAISVYDLRANERLLTVSLDQDTNMAINSLAVWPG